VAVHGGIFFAATDLAALEIFSDFDTVRSFMKPDPAFIADLNMLNRAKLCEFKRGPGGGGRACDPPSRTAPEPVLYCK
jgi:hypothetical protein